MSAPSTNIRVSVQWTEQTVFAGEDIECQITFKNIASSTLGTTLQIPSANGSLSVERRKKPLGTQVRDAPNLSLRTSSIGRGHRTTLSLHVPAASVSSQSISPNPNSVPAKPPHEGGAHKRSVSIISLGAGQGVVEEAKSHGSVPERPRGASRGHGRSASLQLVPRRQAVAGGPLSATHSQRSITQPSPSNLSRSPLRAGSDGLLKRFPSPTTAPNTPNISEEPSAVRKGSAPASQTFKFPAVASPSIQGRPFDQQVGAPYTSHNNAHLLSPRPREAIPAIPEKLSSITRVLSPASIAGTPRSSGEFYSLSNNSTETLASEYISQQPARVAASTGHNRRPSSLAPTNHHRSPETLMMGFAQVLGSFTLDASLISQAPFDEVKRKGAVGGQGGGVVGVESNKRDSGLLGSFTWGGLGESLGGLLGGGELSSIKDMRGVASSRSIPLLSTPQSILFVDLQLAPGESRSYKYTFKLPLGLPPSHRGKAIKISYKLVIGTQRPGGAKGQQMKSVDVSFRVLGSINSHGELLGHDLMSPYIILRDQATVTAIERSSESNLELPTSLVSDSNMKPHTSTLADFSNYADELLNKSRHSRAGLHPTIENPRSRRQSSTLEPTTPRDVIDMAILRSNVGTDSRQSANRFEIARSGQRVAVVMLARPAYRLGETISAAIDFSDAEIPCYALHASLETSEKVDSSIALRSEASIFRVTRKVHASHSESTLFARRVMFTPTIPLTATPEFFTSGVGLDWRVRIEFVTPRLQRDRDLEMGYVDLLEEVSRDDRSVVFAATEALDCETFEISVPLRVYGAVSANTDRDVDPSEGHVI